MYKVDLGEIRKIPKGCVSSGLPSKVMIILLEFESNANEETDATVKSLLSSSPAYQIDLSEVSKKSKTMGAYKSSLNSYSYFT